MFICDDLHNFYIVSISDQDMYKTLNQLGQNRENRMGAADE